jgi:maleate cis-trans isomerase
MGSHGIVTAAEVGTLEPAQVVAMVKAADRPDAEAVLVPDTAMHTLAIIPELEAAVGKPVLTANQVTVWKGLQLLGSIPALRGLGTLFGDRP